MAEFFDKASEKVTKAANYVAQKTKKLASDTKLSFDIKKEEADLDYCFERLGRAFYAQAKNGVLRDEKIAKLMAEADERSEKIKNLKAELAKSKNKKICSHCSSVISGNAPYCSNCGSKIVADEEREKEDDAKTDEEQVGGPAEEN